MSVSLAAPRQPAIDILRGAIIALMALDHTRAFFLGFEPDPTDLSETSPALFATRWITHLCAPGFLLLAGISARLSEDKLGRAGLARFLASRGAILIALELTVIGFGWIPAPGGGLMLLQVIWAIGWAMILLALLLPLGPLAIGAIGLIGAALHPLLDLTALGAPAALQILLLDGDRSLALWPDAQGRPAVTLIALYAVQPWAAVMAAGYGFGDRLAGSAARWAGPTIALGAVLVLAFAALRGLSALGDPDPWDASLDPIWSALSFINLEKYPPSPLFLLVTLGLGLIGLGLAARLRLGRLGRALEIFGRAPLFFYVLHLYALRIAGLIAAAAVWGVDRIGPPPLKGAPEWPLWAVWLIWLAAMALLYPPTRWFAELKRRSRAAWIRYL